MKHCARNALAVLAAITMLTAARASEKPFLGGWELVLPDGAAGWLGVEAKNGALEASLLWGWGSVERVASARIEGENLVLTRQREVQRKDAGGKKSKVTVLETITGTVSGDAIRLVSAQPRAEGAGELTVELSGKRSPPLPPAPDLATLNFGPPLHLFNGKDLDGWRLTDPKAINGWRAEYGVLVNHAKQEKGKPHRNYGNLRTDREFGDFNLTLEVRVPKDGNSGVYLRGIYEVQVDDSFGKPLDSHHLGAIYSRIKPTVNAEKPAGEWQTLDITLVERHATVILNGKRIIDNQPIAGCTGGALWSDTQRAGPIYLQGDHTGVEYRLIVLRPVKGRDG